MLTFLVLSSRAKIETRRQLEGVEIVRAHSLDASCIGT